MKLYWQIIWWANFGNMILSMLCYLIVKDHLFLVAIGLSVGAMLMASHGDKLMTDEKEDE